MPMLVRLGRLFKAGPFLRGLPVPLPQQSRSTQYPPQPGRAPRQDVGIQHHERQPPIAFQRILQMERNDRLLLPILQPKVPGNPAVVLVDTPVPLAPAVELADRDVQPSDEPSGADLGLLRPAPDEIHDLVPRIVRNLPPGQSSPPLFFYGNMLRHQFGQNFILRLNLLLQIRDSFLLWLMIGPTSRQESCGFVLEELLLPAVEHGWLESLFVH